MANMLMMRYAASRGDDRNENAGMQSGSSEMRRRMTYENPQSTYNQRGLYGGETVWNSQYPSNEYGGAESRYRGKDGRWRSGTRRSEYDGGAMDYETESSRMSEDEEEERRKYQIEVMPSNVVRLPDRTTANDYRSSRQIGFGPLNTMGGVKEQKEQMMGMSETYPMEFDRETAEHWVHSMRNEDKAHPIGGKWSPDMLKPLAQKYGIPSDGAKFWEFYAMTNAMYSDYGEVARKFGITSPEFYACMAKAWMEDKDAEPDKTALYYEYIVKKTA